MLGEKKQPPGAKYLKIFLWLLQLPVVGRSLLYVAWSSCSVVICTWCTIPLLSEKDGRTLPMLQEFWGSMLSSKISIPPTSSASLLSRTLPHLQEHQRTVWSLSMNFVILNPHYGVQVPHRSNQPLSRVPDGQLKHHLIPFWRKV